MKLQLLVPVMNESDFSKVKEMNLRDADVIFANQTDHCAYVQQYFPERNVSAVMVSTNTRGASLNRNIALAYADAPVIMFADDDQQFTDDFSKVVLREFEKHPEADVIKFGCISTNPERPLGYKAPPTFCKGTFRTMMSSGVPALALRREKFQKCDITFPNSIGPGRKFSNGEDSVFIKDLLRSRLKIYRSPLLISYIHQENSTWFQGYNEEFYITSGYLYSKIYGIAAPIMLVRKAWRLRRETVLPFWKRIALGCRGIRQYWK